MNDSILFPVISSLNHGNQRQSRLQVQKFHKETDKFKLTGQGITPPVIQMQLHFQYIPNSLMSEAGEVLSRYLLLVFWKIESWNRITFSFVTHGFLSLCWHKWGQILTSNLPFMPMVNLACTLLWNYWITELSVIWKPRQGNVKNAKARQGDMSVFTAENPASSKTGSRKRKKKNKNS